MSAIELERLGKRFDLTASRLIADSVGRDDGDDGDDEEEVTEDEQERETPRRGQVRWALKDITASIAPSERVAVVGANGAGKTTLLKIVAGLCLPTEGVVRGRGRVVPVNSMMQPFHATATGVANLSIMGRVLRVERSLLDERLPAIIAFSGLGEQAEKPVRTYSRGMYGRLAMAAVLHLDPDILLIDDGVNVGDIGFRQSVEERLRSVIEDGATLLFAGHKMSQLESHCDRALWLDDGRLREDGPLREVLDHYVAFMLERDETAPNELTERPSGDETEPDEVPADGPALPEGSDDTEPGRGDGLQDLPPEEMTGARLIEGGEGLYGMLASFDLSDGDGEASGEFAYPAQIGCAVGLESFLPDVGVDLQVEIFAYAKNSMFAKGTLILSILPDDVIHLSEPGRHSITTLFGAGLPPGGYTARLRAAFLDSGGAPTELAVLVQRFRIVGQYDDDRLRRFQSRKQIKRRPFLRPRCEWRVNSATATAREEMVCEA